MIELTGQPGQLNFTIEIKRAATGEIEKYDLVGHIINEEPNEEVENGSDTLDSGT